VILGPLCPETRPYSPNSSTVAPVAICRDSRDRIGRRWLTLPEHQIDNPVAAEMWAVTSAAGEDAAIISAAAFTDHLCHTPLG